VNSLLHSLFVAFMRSIHCAESGAVPLETKQGN